STGRPFI
ncbi:hypothetical protein ECNE037_2251, partial [Escherichia coli NE037]